MKKVRQSTRLERVLMTACATFLLAAVAACLGWHYGIDSGQSLDWVSLGGVGSLVGGLFTAAAALLAVVSYRNSLHQRQQDQRDERYSQARRIIVTTSQHIGEATEHFRAHNEAFMAAVPEGADRLEMSNQAMLDYVGPRTILAKATASNVSIYPVFDLEVHVFGLARGSQFMESITHTTAVQHLAPGESTPEIRSAFPTVDRELASVAVAELRFTDIWGQRWRTNNVDTYRVDE